MKDGNLTNGKTPLTVVMTSGDPLPGPPTIAHRDKRVLKAIDALRPAFDADGIEARMQRRRLSDALDRLVAAAPVTTIGLDSTALDTWARSLSLDIAEMNRQLQAAPDVEIASANASAQREQVQALLDAVRARGDATAQGRAAALQEQLQKSGASGAAFVDGSTALDRLETLDKIVDALEPSIGHRAADTMREETSRARDGVLSSSLTADAFAGRRAEIVALLDLVTVRAAPADMSRIAALRASTAALAFAGAGRAGLLRLRADAAAILSRVQLQAELASTGHGPADALVREQVETWRRQVAAARDGLAAPTAGASSALSPRSAVLRVKSLTAGCEFCHDLAFDGDRLAPVNRDLTLFDAATFPHKPHVAEAASCETCHKGVTTSDDRSPGPQDALLPDVASCRTCHAPGRSRNDCVSCHAYHAPVSRRAGVLP